MRERGELAQPDDIVIVAIDDPSIAALGRFPSTRSYSADVVDRFPRFSQRLLLWTSFYERHHRADDANCPNRSAGRQRCSWRTAYRRPGHSETSRSVWLKSLPDIESSAAGVGHSNVESEADGTARELLLKLADDDSVSRWALALNRTRRR